MRGDGTLENSLHIKFAGDRIRGEWFKRTDDLLAFIDRKRDLTLWEDCASLERPIPLNKEKDDYGVVQVIDEDDPRFGQYGYWDDDHSELEETCEYCKGAEKRGLDGDDECSDCRWGEYAIVYFGLWTDGWEYYPHESLRKINESIESTRAEDIVSNLVPTFDKDQVKTAIEACDIMAPIYEKLTAKRDAEMANNGDMGEAHD